MKSLSRNHYCTHDSSGPISLKHSNNSCVIIDCWMELDSGIKD